MIFRVRRNRPGTDGQNGTTREAAVASRMRRTVASLAGVLLALTWSIDVPAAPPAGASEAFAAGSRAFEARDWEQALEHFRRARDAGMEGPAVWYNLGVCQYRLGRYADALDTFRSIIDRFPAMAPLAGYNAGLALAKQERFDEAEAAFLRAADTGDPRLAGLALAMLERIAPEPVAPVRPQEAGWTGFLDVSAGYDDNVALLDDAILPAGESTDSAFAHLFGQLSSPSKDAGLHAAASAYLVRYPDAGRFDQSVLRLGTFWRWSWRDIRLDAGPHYSRSTLDGEGFEQRFGAALALTRALGGDTRLMARLTVEEIRDLGSPFGFVEGSRGALQLRLKRYLGPGEFLLEYELSVDDRATPSVSPTRHELLAGYRHWIGDLWSVEGSAAFRWSRYDDLIEPRDEDRTELLLTLARDLPGDWQLTGQYRLSENDSNISGFSYDRSRFAIGINRVFR